MLVVIKPTWVNEFGYSSCIKLFISGIHYWCTQAEYNIDTKLLGSTQERRSFPLLAFTTIKTISKPYPNPTI